MQRLWYTGYVVLSLTWLGLLYVEWQVPGFVSQVFPSYIILLAASVCGVASLLQSWTSSNVDARVNYLIAGVTGLLLAAVMISDGNVFGAYRFILAFVILGLPVILVKLFNSDNPVV